MKSDPVLVHARREGWIIGAAWLGATLYCCVYSYLFGYIRHGRPLGPGDVRPVWGVPHWFAWGVIAPWGICGLFTAWFAGWFMADDDLGQDHADELEADIREGGHDVG